MAKRRQKTNAIIRKIKAQHVDENREAYMQGFQAGAKALKFLIEEQGATMETAMDAVERHNYVTLFEEETPDV